MRTRRTLAAAGIMLVAGCGGTDTDQPAALPSNDSSPTASAPAEGESTAQDADGLAPASEGAAEVADTLGCELQQTTPPAVDTEVEYDCGPARVIDFTATSITPDELAQVKGFYATRPGDEVLEISRGLLVVAKPDVLAGLSGPSE